MDLKTPDLVWALGDFQGNGVLDEGEECVSEPSHGVDLHEDEVYVQDDEDGGAVHCDVNDYRQDGVEMVEE